MRKLVIAALLGSLLGLTGCSMMDNCPVHRMLFGSKKAAADEAPAGTPAAEAPAK